MRAIQLVDPQYRAQTATVMFQWLYPLKLEKEGIKRMDPPLQIAVSLDLGGTLLDVSALPQGPKCCNNWVVASVASTERVVLKGEVYLKDCRANCRTRFRIREPIERDPPSSII